MYASQNYNDTDMLEALDSILVQRIQFGKIELAVNLVPANKKVANYVWCVDWAPKGAEALKCVLKENTALDKIVEKYIPMLKCKHVFAIFKPVVLQFACDNIASPWKLVSRVYEDAAREIFHDTGVSFCTNKA